jgi:WD40 repeat protein
MGSLEAQYTNDDDIYFLTGCRNGNIKLWKLNELQSLRTYDGPGDCVSRLAVVVENSTFVAAYSSGMARLWAAWTGACLCLYKAAKDVRAVCSLWDGYLFVTGGSDKTLRLCDSSFAWEHFQESHTLVLSVACVEAGTAFVSGS